MICSIVACGDSAKDWFKVPCDLSIGVNDCLKFGHQVDYLVVVNSPVKFKADRLETIKNSKPKRFYCHDSNWKKWFKDVHQYIGMRPFITVYRKGRVYSTKTSPFVAITLAVKEGATEIILWGVDFINHHKFSPGKHRDFDKEFDNYRMLFEQMEKEGIKVWLGNENSSFKGHLKLYHSVDKMVDKIIEGCNPKPFLDHLNRSFE